jgi:hypothetical protein
VCFGFLSVMITLFKHIGTSQDPWYTIPERFTYIYGNDLVGNPGSPILKVVFWLMLPCVSWAVLPEGRVGEEVSTRRKKR